MEELERANQLFDMVRDAYFSVSSLVADSAIKFGKAKLEMYFSSSIDIRQELDAGEMWRLVGRIFTERNVKAPIAIAKVISYKGQNFWITANIHIHNPEPIDEEETVRFVKGQDSEDEDYTADSVTFMIVPRSPPNVSIALAGYTLAGEFARELESRVPSFPNNRFVYLQFSDERFEHELKGIVSKNVGLFGKMRPAGDKLQIKFSNLDEGELRSLAEAIRYIGSGAFKRLLKKRNITKKVTEPSGLI